MSNDWINVGCAVIYHEGKLLIAKRHEHDTLGGHWEFPGGKQEAGESIEECLIREAEEELGISIKPLRELRITEHRYPERNLKLHFYLCAWVEGEARAIDCADIAWVGPEKLSKFQFPPADKAIIQELISGRGFDEDGRRED